MAAEREPGADASPGRSDRSSRSPELTFELLWRTREPPSRGPKPSLSVEQIVEQAIGIADAEGLAAVSMRRVAEHLGVTTMSLYRYVPSKDDLLELMLEGIAASVPDPDELPPHWRDALAWWARENLAVFRRHPWLNQYAWDHPPLGPNNIGWMEAALRPLVGTGLTEGDMVGVLTILSGFVRIEAQQEFSMARGAQHTGVAPEEWGRVYGTMLEKVVNDGNHPALAQVVAAGVFDSAEGPDEDFEYGLAFILDGVEALIRTRTADTHQRDRA